MKPKKIIIANWKMHPDTGSEAKKLSQDISKVMKSVSGVEIIIAPSFVHIPLLSFSSKKIFLGAQDVCSEEKGSYTGEISVTQLKKMSVSHVIVGHSEKRLLGDTDELINRKVKTVLKAKLTPILCIGEKTRDTQGIYLAFLQNQLKSAFTGVSRADVIRSIIAYEPVWAIGKSAEDAMKPQDIHEIVLFIQKVISEIYGRDVSKKITLLYGGAVEAQNAEIIVREGNVDGLLVGHASLSIKTLHPIISALDSIK